MTFPCEMPLAADLRSASSFKRQRTLKEPVSISGRGLFSGKEATLKIYPAGLDHGYVFQRVDLPGTPLIPAKLDFVRSTPRCTVLGEEDVYVQTVEHLLAALRAMEIDNALIEISGPEVPILDGSSLPYVELIESAGSCLQSGERPVFSLQTPVYWSQGDIHLVALPSESYRISYTLHYPHSNFLKSQYISFMVEPEFFKNQIAPCRTFSLYEEIASYLERGMLKGGSLENGVIIKEEKVMNPEGLRFSDEPARHKALDLIGDLSLIDCVFNAHIIAVRSGHTSNNAFARILLQHLKSENL